MRTLIARLRTGRTVTLPICHSKSQKAATSMHLDRGMHKQGMRHVDFTHPPSEASAVIKQRHVSELMYPCTKDLCRMNLDTFAPVDLCICCNCCKTECQNCMALLLVPKGLFTASCFRGSSRRRHQAELPMVARCVTLHTSPV